MLPQAYLIRFLLPQWSFLSPGMSAEMGKKTCNGDNVYIVIKYLSAVEGGGLEGRVTTRLDLIQNRARSHPQLGYISFTTSLDLIHSLARYYPHLE